MARRGAWAVVLVAWGGAALAQPASAEGQDLTRRPPPPRSAVSERLLQGASDSVDASEALDEMIDELAADMARLGPAQISPLVIERVEVSQNIDPGFAAIIEARIVAALYRAAGVAVVRCPECRATRGTVEDGAWVVRRGITSRAELVALSDNPGARSVLRAWFTLREAPDSLALDVEVARTSDASVAFAEGYRVDPSTVMLYRGADTAQSRAEKLKDLEDRIERRPRFGQAVLFGAMSIPDKVREGVEDKGPILGAFGTYRIYESFGPTREFKVGLNVGGFLHTTRLAGGLLTASVLGRITGASLYGPDLSLGIAGGGFITGQGGNTAVGSVLGELLLGHRLAIQASLSWVQPFDLANKGDHEIGGISPQVGMGFVW